MLNVGDPVPDFTLPLAYASGTRDPVAFRTLLAKANGPLVISFYPLAFTGVCTKQVCEMRDRQAMFDHVGATVVGFSIDTAPTNVHFARANQLAHGIYSDPNREVVDTLWETMTVAGVHRTAKRGWLVITRDGIVAEKWVTDVPTEWSGLDVVNAALHKAAPHAH